MMEMSKNNFIHHFVSLFGINKDIERFCKFTNINLSMLDADSFYSKWGKESPNVQYSLCFDYTGNNYDRKEKGIIELYFKTEKLNLPIKKYIQWTKRYPSLIINWECVYEKDILYFDEETKEYLDWKYLPNRFFLKDYVK